ncbi:biopolymer transporter ExbD [Iodidimonas gelatinilytica]|uniref:Biopolymer transporter ExbD n=2 Tax=Iodidimonas TaxID=2066486 RepID=A0A5A7MMW2_9PROT|nr:MULTISPECIES: biopolymer transporter ExbD [Iodidimonas]GEQ97176.1 biopolymer transporter ExbD [Iodidimonas gelatinilytica]GEQ99508.1 biopolymer transporter ExbD [Iodidimonas gelatinilytica]GER07392.1 biopolymer transporter ExbD [Kordiimonadales bacterium JCM 17843]GGO10702.1 biopolymer transporter ExbD [Iodidimonas muriae]
MRDHAQTEEDAEINMTPMLDIVFIMLIFFIVTATFIKEAGVEINKPPAVTAEKKDRASILIAITETDEIWINRKQVDLKSLRTNIEKLHAENPQGTVVVQADARSKAGLMIAVTEAVNDSGVPSVAVSTKEK